MVSHRKGHDVWVTLISYKRVVLTFYVLRSFVKDLSFKIVKRIEEKSEYRRESGRTSKDPSD